MMVFSSSVPFTCSNTPATRENKQLKAAGTASMTFLPTYTCRPRETKHYHQQREKFEQVNQLTLSISTEEIVVAVTLNIPNMTDARNGLLIPAKQNTVTGKYLE